MAFFQTFAETEGAEGSDELKIFFSQNSKLKLEWYQKLVEQDIDFDDLMDSAENDLRDMLKDIGLSSKAVARIVNAVRKVPDSTIYKILNATKISIVSTEEHNAANSVHTQSTKITEAITAISSTMQKLKQNSQVCEKIINDKFDNIINNANKRRNQLLTTLKHVTNAKCNKLAEQQNKLSKSAEKLDEFYAVTQNMMKDMSMDATKRKIKILSQAKELLNAIYILRPVKNGNIEVTVDINNINAVLSQIGAVSDGECVIPSIKVNKMTHNSANITIKTNEEQKNCVAHKIEYVACNSNDVNDEKLEWNSVNIESAGQLSVEYEIKSLDQSTIYWVRAASQNNVGWGAFSKSVSFKTTKIDAMSMMSPQMIFDSFGIDSSRMRIVSDGKEVNCLCDPHKSPHGGSIRFKLAMPTKNNNHQKLTYITWEFYISLKCGWGDSVPFWGVVSNRTKDFSKSVYHELKDAFGINCYPNYIYEAGKVDYGKVKHKQLSEGELRIEYVIQESKLNFYVNNENNALCSIRLPTDIPGITHWYPAMSLRDNGDLCKITKNFFIK